MAMGPSTRPATPATMCSARTARKSVTRRSVSHREGRRYTGMVPDTRRYQLQIDAANRLISDLLDAEGVPPEARGFYQQMLTTVLKLHEDGAGSGELKVTNAALKELRYGYKVFAPYRHTRKVTV